VADDALGTDDAVGLLLRLKSRDVSAAELRAAARARLAAVNPHLNAVVCEVADEGDLTGPFAGIPSVIKDNEDIAGYATLQGSWAVSDRPVEVDSPFVAQFRALGLAPIAKTTLPEFGLTASTETSRFGATRNPWNTDYSAGGSSGGSAALVAAGVVPIAHANDGGGSIRIPAAACGLVGLKSTRGRIIDSPDLEKLPIKLPVQGVLTRSVRDSALYYAQAEKAYANPDLAPIGLVESASSERLRIGMIRGGIRGLTVDAETTTALMSTALLLGRMGHHVDETEIPFADKFGNDFLRYWAMLAFTLRYGGSRVFGQGFDGTKTEQVTKGLARMFTTQAERMPLSIRRLRKAASDPDPMFENFDVVLTPVTGYPAPEIGFLGPDVEFRTHLVRLLQFSSFTPSQNVTGSPAISLPLGRTRDGRPIGVQLSAPRGQEARLLQVAYELEEAAPWQTHAPLLPPASVISA